MKKIFALALVLFILFSITACSSNSGSQSSTQTSIDNELIGAWERENNSDHVYVFFADGNYYYTPYGDNDDYGGNYSVYDNLLRLNRDGSTTNYLYTFTVVGDRLTIKNYFSTTDSGETYKKVK